MNRFVQSDALYGMERPPPVLLDRVGETVRTDDDQVSNATDRNKDSPYRESNFVPCGATMLDKVTVPKGLSLIAGYQGYLLSILYGMYRIHTYPIYLFLAPSQSN